MSSLIIANFNLLDQEKLAQYGAAAAVTIANYGGEFIAKGQSNNMSGDSDYTMAAVIQFADKETATKWYKSPEYQAIIPLRDEAMDSQFLLVG
ncbi:DUF1330 domain-containing protein [Leucothrix arctica]|uniref:DUF1330 domain-containing protein n=1 Tax=Leucothrix arctica TaxID=1481894 RepID=A0A317CBG6_9GAMM|nr:DUF1330 domain-containing protein [Leucothrix arctica]PWQ93432.1 DUF1330 domain-containing protein [Leucothrix arctica]